MSVAGEDRGPLDHDDFGLNQSKLMNVIDSKSLERDMQIGSGNLREPDCAEKAAQRPTFPHPALAQEQPAVSQLYGRRKGKKLRPHQAALLQEVLPRLALDATQEIADLPGQFPQRPAQIWLEIGFGGGEHLVAQSLAHPDIGFLGCEPFVNGVAKLLARIEAEKLENLRIFQGNAAVLIAALPDRSLDGIYLLYPDPWPKRRQRKRRFLSDAMVADLARVMRSGAELRFATDIDDYAGWVLARIQRSTHFAWLATSSADWQKPWAGWTGTRYEAKALAAGRRPVYLTFVRV
jgi:tRNA (guanine-N7-)-methyltransferase